MTHSEQASVLPGTPPVSRYATPAPALMKTESDSTIAEPKNGQPEQTPEVKPQKQQNPLLLNRDYRASLPLWLNRWTGKTAPQNKPLPFPPFTWISRIPLRYEIWIYATIGAFVGILVIEACMTTSTIFRDVYHSPIIVGPLGASAILVFALTDAPLAQPRNTILGQVIPAIIGTCITRLWIVTHPDYASHLDNKEFYGPSFVNGALCMSLGLLGQMVFGVLHPPGGATAVVAATDPVIVALSWRYIPVVLVSSVLLVGVGIIFNNLGRRRYPVFWWAPGRTFVREPEILIRAKWRKASLSAWNLYIRCNVFHRKCLQVSI